MSHNLYVKLIGVPVNNRKRKTKKQTKKEKENITTKGTMSTELPTEFALRQTPTKITKEILMSEDPYKAYVAWIKADNKNNPDSWAREQNLDHLKQLEKWIVLAKESGYRIKFFSDIIVPSIWDTMSGQHPSVDR